MRIEFRGLARAFDGKTVLDGIDFDDDVTTLAIIGPSGGGKSTLLRILGGLLPATAGEVRVDGAAIPRDEAALARYRATLGFVFQDGGLFHHLSAHDNIALPLRVVHGVPDGEADERAEALLARFGLAGEGGKRPAQLSGGQRQRVAIARALLADCPILVLDEATSALDSESEHLVQDAFATLMRGRTCIVVAHRLSTVASLDRIVVLADGKVIEDGPHDELIAAGGEYAHLWSRQTGAYLE